MRRPYVDHKNSFHNETLSPGRAVRRETSSQRPEGYSHPVPEENGISFGLMLENFTPASGSPDFQSLVAYAEAAEKLGFDSLWAWDHVLLGSRRPFPFLDSLSVLAALAARTRRVQLGTGVLVLPLRNPVVLAKVTSTIDLISGGRLVLGVASGWYSREFDACGVPFDNRGEVFERNLQILQRFWTEQEVNGEIDSFRFDRSVMLPLPHQRPRPPVLIGGYVDRVLKRVARNSDGWMTYLYTPESFSDAWKKILGFAEAAGRDPASLTNVAQLPICVADSFETADRRIRDFIDRYLDVAPWSQSTPDSAIRGTVDQCLEQITSHLDVGVQHVVFIPCDYETEQIQQISAELLPQVEGWRAGITEATQR